MLGQRPELAAKVSAGAFTGETGDVGRPTTLPSYTAGTFEWLLQYIEQDWRADAVLTHMKFVSQMAAALPPTTTWAINQNFDVASSIYQLLSNRDYLRTLWPTLNFMLGDNIKNDQWAAALATTFAVYDWVRTYREVADGEKGEEKEPEQVESSTS